MPVLFTIELAADLSVYYKTVDGKSLNDIFPPRIEEMKPGTSYTFEPPTHEGYTYAGYKKTTDGSDPSKFKDITEGDPPKLEPYKGNFEQYRIYQYYKVDEEVCEPGQTASENGVCTPPPPPPPFEACTYTILPPAQSQAISKQLMNPEAAGHILGDDRANGRHFDATQGIPTSENLYANAWGYEYLFQHTFGEMKGKIKYDCEVKVTYSLTWKEKNNKDEWKTKTGSASKTYTFDFTRDYTYWQIQQLQVLGVNQAKLSNYALPGGSVTLQATNYTAPALATKASTELNDHVRPAKTGSLHYSPSTIDGGRSGRPSPPNDQSKLKSMAESKTDEPQVRNDAIQFSYKNKDTEVMNGDWIKASPPAPKEIPAPTKIRSYKDAGEQILYKGSQLISRTLINRGNTPSTGTMMYTMVEGDVNGQGDQSYPINGINSVTVHTPVVDYASVSDDKTHNQKKVPSADRMALILNRPFTVRIPTNGQHLDINAYPGYGKRDYAKYFKTKQVWFPFDVYSADHKTFYPKQTWIDIPVQQLDTVFQLPVWIDEGNYTIAFRTIAENAPTSFTTQQDANTDLNHHVAKDTVDVEVIGRLYDFHVTDIADFAWETVFRQAVGSPAPTGRSYWVGPNGIDGEPRGNTRPYVLPILRGSHPQPGSKNVTVKTGYHFKFDLKTMGNMFGDRDAIQLTPSFYYQDRSTATAPERIPVDLYYHSDKQSFIRIGSAADVERRQVTLNQRLRNVTMADLKQTATSIYELTSGWMISKEQYLAQFLKRAGQPTYTGGYDIQILPSPLRTFIQSPARPANASATSARVNASVQQWYGEYSLPARVYAVPKGTDLAAYGRSHVLDEKSPIFLKQGFIVVNLDIESIVNGDTTRPHLQYIHAPLSNQWWQLEGYDGTDGKRDHLMTDPYGVSYEVADGDVLFYDTDHSVYDDYTSRGTH
ncbi:DUF5704 domain-containing protein [Paenibacillus hunanensis]|uniref:DUF5704 domain-containing protein n=1 Tax=Paenibacillus hunanensis TaxID=539262 RepID=A0ABU1J4U4_9BACL|nr:DUF5704 domain-containing protein [Paenibacillus hunanensis]MDR6246534.1 hypothetical protein [Paenibacillus hunanensis]